MKLEINTKTQVIRNLFWKFMERCGVQGIQFIVSLLLARLLAPEDYGIIALITIFVAISNVFIQSGFSTALIQKKEVDELDFSSVFYVTLGMAGLCYILLFLSAPTISSFYGQRLLVPVLRVISLTLFTGAVNSVQYAVVSRKMDFKKFFFSSLGASIPSGVIGIAMAYSGFGVWSLVGQQLSVAIFTTIILWCTVKWRPILKFSLRRVRSLFSYGWKLLCSSLIDTLYNNIYGLVIGKTYSSVALAYYNRADQFPNLLVSNINGSIMSVLLPTLSATQDDVSRVKSMVRRSIVTSSFIVFPMMMGLAVCAEPIVELILTEKWIPCVPLMQMLCFSYALWPIHTANLQAINALGHSDIYLKLEIVKKIIGIAALCISIPFGIYIMVGMKIVTSIISTFINSYPNKELLGYSTKEQWKDIMPPLGLTLLMGIVTYSITFIGMNPLITLIVQIIVGILIYIGLAYLFKVESSMYIFNIIKPIFKKKITAKLLRRSI